jgi:signal transduction histidine kinase
MLMFKRLTTRLVLSQLLLIGLAMALLSFVLLSLVQSYFVQAAQDSLLIQARLTAQALAVSGMDLAALPSSANVAQSQLPAAANSVQASQLQNALPSQAVTQNVIAAGANNVRLSLDLETRVRILDLSGRVRSDSANADLGRDLSSLPVAAAALAGTESSSVDDNVVLTAVPLRTAGTPAGAVLLSQPLRDVTNVMADLGIRLLVSAFIALVVAALAGVLLARGIARPVRQLTAAANQLAQGNFDYPIAATSPDELGELARAFRSMSTDLQRMLQARTDLVANVSHELRTPLTAVKGLVETLRDGAVDDPSVRDSFLASIEQQNDRLIRLVNELLTLSRADSDALALQRRPCDLAALARQVAGQLAARAAKSQVTIRVEDVREDTSAQAMVDPDRIQQVLVNLLDNAIRYSPRGDIVRVRVAPEEDGVRVAVSDHGPGIAPEEQARVFERFYRGDKSRARHANADGGAGLGLSIAETLVRAHGGRIGIDSAPAAGGTTVWFSLPLQPPMARPAGR